MNLQARVKALEERVAALESERPGRKALPIIISEAGICGVDPERDSDTCPDASLYRRRKGCLGTACVAKATTYYEEYRAAAAVVLPPPKRRR